MMKQVNIDLSRDREDIHTELAEKLTFPSYYGRNLDALYDVLTELSEQAEIVLSGTSEYGQKVKAVIADAAQVNDKIIVVTDDETEEDIADGMICKYFGDQF